MGSMLPASQPQNGGSSCRARRDGAVRPLDDAGVKSRLLHEALASRRGYRVLRISGNDAGENVTVL